MKQSFWAIAVLCYLLATVLWLVEGLVAFLYEGGEAPLYMGLSQAEFVNVEPLEGHRYAVLSTDSQIILNDLDIQGGLLVLEGEFQNYPGELDLYYKKVGQSDYSANRRAFAFPMQGGGYGYRVPIGNYDGIRIDMGTQADNVLTAEGLIVHPQRNPWDYFQFSLRRLLVLLILPPIAACVIYTTIEWGKLIGTELKKRKRERKHE